MKKDAKYNDIKEKLLYLSPFAPMKSGISDYSEVLIYELRKFFDITLVIDNYKLANKDIYKKFEVKVYNKNYIDFDDYKYKVYNLGNNPYYHSFIYKYALTFPGTIILHDFVLYYLIVDYYHKRNNLYTKVYEIEGARGLNIIKEKVKQGCKNLLDCKSIAKLLPLNQEIINLSPKVVVHSEFTKNLVLEKAPDTDILKINMINMNQEKYHKSHFNTNNSNDRYLNKKYGIKDQAFVIASFGYIAPTKLNHIICEMVNRFNKDNQEKIYYLMVGEGSYVDEQLSDYIIKTGYLKRKDYDSVLLRCNLVANLRYPSMGETSISLIHAMGQGKACIVTDDAWFSELPDNIVIKIDNRNIYSDLIKNLLFYFKNQGELNKIAKKANNYVEQLHSVEIEAEKLFDFLQNI